MERRDLFPPDRGLQARMAVALLFNVIWLGALLVGIVVLTVTSPDGWSVAAATAFMILIGAVAIIRDRKRLNRHTVHDWPASQSHAETAVGRLSELADIAPPEVRLVDGREPQSWTYSWPGARPRLYLTRGLVKTLSPGELDAVIAHELSHIANHDAAVMTLMAGPPEAVLASAREIWKQRHDDWRLYFALPFFAPLLAFLVGPPWLVARVISRHRELAADRGAAILTAHPSMLASALLKASGEIARIPARDLRTAGAGEVFYLLPSTPVTDADEIISTHPTIDRRLEQLERLERSLATARPVL